MIRKMMTAVLLSAMPVMTALADDAANYPSKPISFVIGYPPGGASDIMSRLIGAKLHEKLGQSVVVENRPGAGGNIATNYVNREPADGYTLLLGTIAHATNMSVYKAPGYDTRRDFIPVIQFMKAPSLLVVRADAPYGNLEQLLAAARAEPGKLSFASTGAGGSPHLAGELLKLRTGIDILHVPYKGAGPVLNDLIGGYVTMSFMTIPGALQQIHAGKLKPIAIASQQRSAELPNVPTMAEAGVPDFEVNSWNGLFVRKNTPPAIVEKLNRSINTILTSPEVKKQIETEGAIPVGGTEAEFGDYVDAEIKKWAEVAKAANIQL